MRGAGGGGWSSPRAPSLGAGGRRGAARLQRSSGRSERVAARSALAPAPVPARARAGARPALIPLGPDAHLMGKWHSCLLLPRPPPQPPPPPRRASGLCLRPCGSGSGCACDSPAGLSSSADRAAQRPGSARAGPTLSAPGVKLRPSLGSRENLLKPGVAPGGDGEAGDRTGPRILGPSGVVPLLGPDCTRRLGKGLVDILARGQKGDRLRVGLLTSARAKFGFLASSLNTQLQLRELKTASGSVRIDAALTAPPFSSLRSPLPTRHSL